MVTEKLTVSPWYPKMPLDIPLLKNNYISHFPLKLCLEAEEDINIETSLLIATNKNKQEKPNDLCHR